MPTAEYVSVKEAAEICGCDRATIQRWIHNGKLHADRLGNLMWIIRRSDLENLE